MTVAYRLCNDDAWANPNSGGARVMPAPGPRRNEVIPAIEPRRNRTAVQGVQANDTVAARFASGLKQALRRYGLQGNAGALPEQVEVIDAHMV